MDCFLLIVELFLGLFILFALGRLVGHIFRLDDFLKGDPDHHINDSNL